MIYTKFIFAKVYIRSANFKTASRDPLNAWFSAYLAVFLAFAPLALLMAKSVSQFAATWHGGVLFFYCAIQRALDWYFLYFSYGLI